MKVMETSRTKQVRIWKRRQKFLKYFTLDSALLLVWEEMNIAFGFFAKIPDMGSGSEKPRQEHDAEFMNSFVAHKKGRNEKSSFSGTFSPLCGCMGRQTFASLGFFYFTGCGALNTRTKF